MSCWFVLDGISCSPELPQTYLFIYFFEGLFPLYLPSIKFTSEHSHIRFSCCAGIKATASRMLGRHSTKQRHIPSPVLETSRNLPVTTLPGHEGLGVSGSEGSLCSAPTSCCRCPEWQEPGAAQHSKPQVGPEAGFATQPPGDAAPHIT